MRRIYSQFFVWFMTSASNVSASFFSKLIKLNHTDDGTLFLFTLNKKKFKKKRKKFG